MYTGPFRWTKQHKIIRDALKVGMTKEHILDIIRGENKAATDLRPSEAAMKISDWSIAIDRVMSRLPGDCHA